MLEVYFWLTGRFAAACGGDSFFGFPTWHKYLSKDPTYCSPQLGALDDFWKIGLAIVEMLLRLVILVSIIYVMLGGLKYITARGNPDKLNTAKTSIVDALIGLAVAVVASAVVAFIGSRFTQS